VIDKNTPATEKQVAHLEAERNILRRVQHPFLVSYKGGYETPDKLHFVFELCPGGEMFQKLKSQRYFSEAWSKFYAAEVILAIEYLHSLDVLYRDLKPENVVLDSEGHALLIDFGLSKEGITDAMQAKSFVGTPEYMAPEMVQQTGHGRALDWWTVGIFLYEMLVGIPPFYAKDKETMYDKILRSELKFPRGISPEAKAVIRKLLNRDPTQRIGIGPGGAEEIKVEPFFADLDWDVTLSKKENGPLAGEVKVLGLNDFDFLTTIGEGSFGKVMLVRKKEDAKLFAMKAMRIDSTVRKYQVQHAHTERYILQRCSHPMIVKLIHEFQTENNLVLILDFCCAGSLRHHLVVASRFSFEATRHWISQLVLAIDYLHANHIIYRDLKPDNIILDLRGHAILTDFGLAKECPGDAKTTTFCGTPAYLAPEVVKGRRYGKAVDWWGVGVLCYELLSGHPPFESSDLSVLCDQIVRGRVSYTDIEARAKELIASLLQGDAGERLGAQGDGAEVKKHPFFSGISWGSLLEKKGVAPYSPMGSIPRFDAQDLRGLLENMATPDEIGAKPGAAGKAEEEVGGLSGLFSGAMGAVEGMLDELVEDTVEPVSKGLKGGTQTEQLVWKLLTGLEATPTSSAAHEGHLTRQVVAETLVSLLPCPPGATSGVQQETSSNNMASSLRAIRGGVKVLARALSSQKRFVLGGCLSRWGDGCKLDARGKMIQEAQQIVAQIGGASESTGGPAALLAALLAKLA